MGRPRTEAESDVGGCVRLHSPEFLRPRGSLQDDRAPVLALVDALAAGGWQPTQHRVLHRPVPPGVLQYDARDLLAKRLYLQCLLLLPGVFERGQEPFSSTETPLFFRMLKKGRSVPVGLTPAAMRQHAAECGEVEGLCGADDEAMRPLVAVPQPPSHAAADTDDEYAPDVPFQPRRPPVADAQGSGDSGSDFAAEGSHAGEQHGAAAVAEPAAQRSGSESLEGSDRELLFAVQDAAAAEQSLPQRIAGMPTSVLRGHPGRCHARLVMQCPSHAGCSRSRSIALQVGRFGQQASAIYLSCWAARAHLTREAHRRYRPSVADMDGHVAAGLEW